METAGRVCYMKEGTELMVDTTISSVQLLGSINDQFLDLSDSGKTCTWCDHIILRIFYFGSLTTSSL